MQALTLNKDTPTFDDGEQEIKGKLTRMPFCHSKTCGRDNFGILGTRKFTKKDECPDCGDYLVWQTIRC